MLDVVPATGSDAAALLALREAAAAWLRDRAIQQWEPGEVSAERIGAQIETGEWFVHRIDGAVAGGLRLLWSDREVWGERSEDAGYVHGLVIDRRHAGADLGARLLDWAGQRARGNGRAFLRLDCVESNVRLRRYYSDRGFREMGRRDLGDMWWPVTLFEKPV